MIDREAFKAEWDLLESRFGRAPDAKQMAAYFGYLSPQMETAQFQAAARSIWATAKWWPRPADFLLVHAAGEWQLVIRCIEGYRPPDWPWSATWAQLSERAQSACKAIGGMEAMKAMFGKDAVRAKEAWERAYEQATATEALALPPAPDARRLRPVA